MSSASFLAEEKSLKDSRSLQALLLDELEEFCEIKIYVIVYVFCIYFETCRCELDIFRSLNPKVQYSQ